MLTRTLIYCFVLSLFILFGCETNETVRPTSNHKEDFVVIAHRGASAYAPEHTIPAYELALKHNADYIEIDLQMTADNVLIAMHDDTVNRTTNGSGLVKSHTLEEIKRLDAGSWFNKENPTYASPFYQGIKVPTLEEIIEHFGRDVRYYIETKSPAEYPEMEEALLEILNRYQLLGEDPKVIIQSFSPQSLIKIHNSNPSIPLVQLLHNRNKAILTNVTIKEIKTYAVGIGPNFESIDKEFVQRARDADLEVHPYTVNREENLSRLIDWGITGAFTNYPDMAKEILD